MTRIASEASLALALVLTLAACILLPLPVKPCSATTAEESAINDAAAAVEAVRAHLASSPSPPDFDASEVREDEREWYVNVPSRPASDDVDLERRHSPFRVCKADGRVEYLVRY